MPFCFVNWTASPVLFHLGPLEIRWYSLMFLIGFCIGYKIVEKMFKHEGAPERWLGSLLIWLGIGTIVGARLGHCIFYEWSYYSAHPLKILYVWEGGLASHGGTIGCIITVILFSKFTAKRSPMWTFDRVAVPTALVATLIRLGNLFNSEIFGHATTLPWGFMFPKSPEWVAQYYGQACHPTQLYEALCYLLLFGWLMWLYWKRNAEERPGLLFGIFLIGVFASRFLIEFVKNNQEAFEQGMALNMGQILSIPFVLLGIFLVIRAYRRPRLHLSFPNKFPPAEKKK